jgi:hypothetical protein
VSRITRHEPTASRLRARHLVAFGAACGIAGWAAATTSRPSQHSAALEKSPTLLPPPPDSIAADAPPPPPAGRSHAQRFRRGRILVLTGVASLLVFASVGFSAGPGSTLEAKPSVDPRVAARIAAKRAAARKARRAEQAARAARKAEAARIALLRRLELAGIGSRRVGLPPREAEKARRLAALRLIPAPRPSEQAVALERYVDALGPEALLTGLDAQRTQLQEKVLSDPRIHIYPGGRSDVASGRLDIRILALLEYLAEAHGDVSVSCLISGHSHFVAQSEEDKRLKRPRRVSAHVYGRAVDISAVGGIPIAGHQEPGGITEQTIREILSLPSVVLPRQVISLLSLGGPSFPLPDHGDHIHVGY